MVQQSFGEGVDRFARERECSVMFAVVWRVLEGLFQRYARQKFVSIIGFVLLDFCCLDVGSGVFLEVDVRWLEV